MRFDDLFALAYFWPVGQIATGAFVQHLGRSSQCSGQLFGLFKSFFLALVDDVRLAAIQAAIDECASGFQDVLGSRHSFGWVSIALSDEFVQFGGMRGALGLTRFRWHFVHFDQAADRRFEVSIAAQFEDAQEFLDTFAFRRFRACVHACLGFGGDRAEFRPGLSISHGGRNSGGAADVALDEFTDFGTAFRSGHFFRVQMAERCIAAHFGLDRFAACGQARINGFISEDATESSQQNNDLHFRLEEIGLVCPIRILESV